ncbi:MAG TPA: alcohol dehydrogenase catalytic domain-containing protein [Chthoniobacterales bacterium]|nr:alcohol dehydrogenase catalytic domain-containing protein [Chthoniobacterales bacterium]
MKAVRLTSIGSSLEEQEIEPPRIAASEVLVRIRAAGICHSDAHYRAGVSPVARLPLTLGHEVAGLVEETGESVKNFKPGDRVCVHYLATCGTCAFCQSGNEQFCATAEMIGKHRDGGYAEFIAVPERIVFHLPEEIFFEEGAILMCSSATSLHAINKARFRAGETVAVFGAGGLGISAIQLARHLGAAKIFAIDINPEKLRLAARFGAVPINATERDPVEQLREMTSGAGVDVALELVGLSLTMRQAVQSLGKLGRAVLVGLTQESFEIAPYSELLNKEAEIIGVSDHLASEVPFLLELAQNRKLDLSHGIIRTIPLEAATVDAALDSLENFGDDVRVVIVP